MCWRGAAAVKTERKSSVVLIRKSLLIHSEPMNKLSALLLPENAWRSSVNTRKILGYFMTRIPFGKKKLVNYYNNRKRWIRDIGDAVCYTWVCKSIVSWSFRRRWASRPHPWRYCFSLLMPTYSRRFAIIRNILESEADTEAGDEWYSSRMTRIPA